MVSTLWDQKNELENAKLDENHQIWTGLSLVGVNWTNDHQTQMDLQTKRRLGFWVMAYNTSDNDDSGERLERTKRRSGVSRNWPLMANWNVNSMMFDDDGWCELDDCQLWKDRNTHDSNGGVENSQCHTPIRKTTRTQEVVRIGCDLA